MNKTYTAEEAWKILVDAGIPDLSESRWPYTYHHDWYRQAHGGSRADAAAVLSRNYPLTADAEIEAMRGALMHLLGRGPELLEACNRSPDLCGLVLWATGLAAKIEEELASTKALLQDVEGVLDEVRRQLAEERGAHWHTLFRGRA